MACARGLSDDAGSESIGQATMGRISTLIGVSRDGGFGACAVRSSLPALSGDTELSEGTDHRVSASSLRRRRRRRIIDPV